MGEIEDEFDVPPPPATCVEGKIFFTWKARSAFATWSRNINSRCRVKGDLKLWLDSFWPACNAFRKSATSFDYEGHRFIVEEIEGHRIAKVRIEKLQPAAAAQAGN